MSVAEQIRRFDQRELLRQRRFARALAIAADSGIEARATDRLLDELLDVGSLEASPADLILRDLEDPERFDGMS